MYSPTGSSLRPFVFTAAVALIYLSIPLSSPSLAQCLPEPALQNFTGGGQSVCPCFVSGERAGVVLQAPPGDYPLEILRVGIGWGSVFGGNPLQI